MTLSPYMRRILQTTASSFATALLLISVGACDNVLSASNDVEQPNKSGDSDPNQGNSNGISGNSAGVLNATLLGTHATGVFDGGSAEIPAFDPISASLFVVNGDRVALDVIDIGDPTAPTLRDIIDLTPFGTTVTSVDVANGLVVASMPATPATSPGSVVFFDTAGNFLKQVTVGALPDMVVFTPDGSNVLVANEGEPSDDYLIDPEGSISIINVARGVTQLTSADVRHAEFGRFNNAELDPDIRIFGPNATVAQDLEPEYIAVSDDSRTAWATLQENNAIAVIDIESATITEVFALGVKDHSRRSNALDPSDRDGAIAIATWPVSGMYQPDGVAFFNVRGRSYLVTANEGQARDLDGFSDEARVKDLVLDPVAFPDRDSLQLDENLGRLKVTSANGDLDGDGDFDRLYSFGTRSISIWSAERNSLVFDSGSIMELITSWKFPANFNSNDDENSFDTRSDDKGPEPTGIVTATVFGAPYAFVTLERIGGIMAFDLRFPRFAWPVFYINNRDFTGVPELGTAGDLAPEGIKIISAEKSPTNTPLMVVANEVSGTTSIYELTLEPFAR